MQENPQASQRHACASNNASVNREYENVTFMGRVSLSLSISPSLSLLSSVLRHGLHPKKKTTHLTPASFRFDVLILCKVKHRSSLLLTGIAWCVPMGTLH